MAELSKEQKKEIRDICKKVVKEDLKRNASSIRILKSSIEDAEEGGFVASATTYFFTVVAEGLKTEAVRYNMSFYTKPHETEEEAFEALKALAGDVGFYKFTKKKVDDDALYQNVYEFEAEEK